jgi:hypothetical protein
MLFINYCSITRVRIVYLPGQYREIIFHMFFPWISFPSLSQILNFNCFLGVICITLGPLTMSTTAAEN